jgi:3-carboxy-cis,cis-muconate cycloisomerase
VPALVTALTALVPPDTPVHLGATSQDIIDTAAMLVTRRCLGEALASLSAAAQRCATLTRSHAGTVMAGRTLLQQAVPTTFGLVTAGWLTAIDEARAQLHQVRASALAVQYGGAAGTLAALGESGQAGSGVTLAGLLADELGLPAPVLPWHTNRLRVLSLAAALTTACAALGKVARDVTLLAQTEVAEVHEGAGGGSSTMPHKQNPVAAVVILGHTKQAPHLLASLASAAEQELQRAAGAWHAEWLPLTHLLRLTVSASAWSAEMLAGLRPDPARMRANLDAARGLPLAEHVAALLAPALGRAHAHDLLVRASARATADGLSLADALLADHDAAADLATAGVTRDQLEAAHDPASYLGSAPEFVARALAAHDHCEASLGT